MERIKQWTNKKMVQLQQKVLDFITLENGDSEFNDGGSTNWGRNIAIGTFIAALVLGLVTGLVQQVVAAATAKIMSWFA